MQKQNSTYGDISINMSLRLGIKSPPPLCIQTPDDWLIITFNV